MNYEIVCGFPKCGIVTFEQCICVADIIVVRMAFYAEKLCHFIVTVSTMQSLGEKHKHVFIRIVAVNTPSRRNTTDFRYQHVQRLFTIGLLITYSPLHFRKLKTKII